MELIAELEKATHLIARHLETEVGDLGITQAEAHVLVQLARHGSKPIGFLHRRFGHKRSTLTNVVDRLERRGLARRELNPEDRRSFLVHLTKAGRRTANRAARVVGALEEKLTARLAQRDVVAVGRVVAALESLTGIEARPAATQPSPQPSERVGRSSRGLRG